MSVSLIIPAFNEAKRLPQFLSNIAGWHNTHPNTILEVIVIDDGSSDNTYSLAQSFAGKLPLRTIKHKRNQGKGAAVQTGIMVATGDLLIFMDADGATDITELPKMIDALSHTDIAIGNRWLPGSQTERHSLLRRFSGWVYRHYMALFGLGKIDTMCGFKGYHKNIAKELFNDLIEPRWLFDTEIAYRAIQARYTITNFPITWESKDGSKLDTKTLLKSALHIWPLIQKIKQQNKIKSTK